MDKVYSVGVVERLLRDYCYVRSGMLGSLPRTSPPTVYVDTPHEEDEREMPFGYANGDFVPYRDMKRASQTRDGVQKAREMQDTHCAILDLEAGVRHLSHDDYRLIRQHYIEGYEFAELASMYGLPSEGAVERKLQAIMRHLTDVMNGEAA